MDSRPPPQGAPPSYAFVTRVYRRNLRPFVLSFAIMTGIWSLISAIAFFRNFALYIGNKATQLAIFSIIIGVLYALVVKIQIVAFFASPAKIPVVRTYAYLSGLVFLIIAAVGLMQIIMHFIFKNEIITTCTSCPTNEICLINDIPSFYGGIFGPQRGGILTPGDAQDWCDTAWNRGSWSTIIAFLITTFLAGAFSVIAFSYLRQVLDPTYSTNAFREPAQRRLRMGNTNSPTHYNPPYSPDYTNYPSYPAPAGSPPKNTDAFVPPYDSGKPPGYVGGDDYRGGFDDMHKGGEFDDGM